MVLSVHIPKTAGVSFRNILTHIHGPGYVQFYWEYTDAWGNPCADVPPGTTCIHGHYSPDELARRFPEAELITWVRDPVERIASSYYYRLRCPDWKNAICVELHEKKLSLLQFAELEWMRDEMSRFFGNKTPADYAFVGIVEDLEASLSRFFRRFKSAPLAMPKQNSNPSQTGAVYDISPAVREKILQLNQADNRLYQACLAHNRTLTDQSHQPGGLPGAEHTGKVS